MGRSSCICEQGKEEEKPSSFNQEELTWGPRTWQVGRGDRTGSCLFDMRVVVVGVRSLFPTSLFFFFFFFLNENPPLFPPPLCPPFFFRPTQPTARGGTVQFKYYKICTYSLHPRRNIGPRVPVFVTCCLLSSSSSSKMIINESTPKKSVLGITIPPPPSSITAFAVPSGPPGCGS